MSIKKNYFHGTFSGLMGTHDEETYKFFQGSAVECIVVPRSKTDGILSGNYKVEATQEVLLFVSTFQSFQIISLAPCILITKKLSFVMLH